ncbi:lipid asymmetry maintenance protein MlaB [Alkalilimnicola sp. S0819]|uniref:STAS domain-containing protein n=1 Tax=Alkalilimnicola sp. S0819 TaxID=2613922 RepID=UPI0012625F03|nr:STAS domain-containing protein [Alkalilimnicola sp. S0819]KAB7623831.1 STAS domain-containing protein [Alkalilimnicola sp. S0819]MPQ16706.1 STAS domain-containing protein [Alkalilimnicola sp. S0819]
MSAARLAWGEGGSCALSGELSVESVPGLWARGDELWRRGPELVLDLSGVRRSDSAGLALLAEWTRQARQHGLSLHYRGMPEQMRALARVSGLERLLPLETNNCGE